MGKSSDTTTVQQADPWIGQQPYLQTGFQTALQNLYSPRSFYPGATYVPFSQQTEQGLGMLENRAFNNPITQGLQGFSLDAMGASPTSGGITDLVSQGVQGQRDPFGFLSRRAGSVPGQAFDTLQQSAQGDFLGGNPYLDQMFGAASDAVTERFQEATVPGIHAAFSSAGRTGGGAHQDVLGRASGELSDSLSRMAANIYGGDYARERDRMLSSAQALGGLGLSQRGQNIGMGSTALQNLLSQQGMDLQGANILSGLYGMDLQNQQFGAGLAPIANQMALGDIQGLLGAGQQVEGMAGNVLSDAIRRHDFTQSEQDDRLGRFIAAIQGNYGGSSLSTTDPGSNPIAGALGGALGGGLLASQLGANSLLGTAGATGLAGLGAWPLMLGGGLLGALI